MPGRNRIRLLLDVAMALLLVALVATGVLLLVVLPPGGGRGRAVLWGLSRHEWGTVHHLIGTGFVFCVLLHVGLNWNRAVTTFLRTVLPGRKAAAPSETARRLAALATVVLVAAAILVFIAICRRAAGT